MSPWNLDDFPPFPLPFLALPFFGLASSSSSSASSGLDASFAPPFRAFSPPPAPAPPASLPDFFFFPLPPIISYHPGRDVCVI
uniref:Putative secreted protein n=1 Tax=Anopheles marajoara TaxID=58244 RepID=A0A2M4CBB7_9DIPT